MSSFELRASAAQRIALCPGSASAAAKVPPPPDSDDALRGTRIHKLCAAILQNQNVESGDDAATAQSMVGRFVGEVMRGEYKLLASEHAMAWECWTGHADAILEKDDALHVVDWKTGWGYVPDAADNAQVRVYVVMASQLWPRSRYVAHIVTPREITSVMYAQADVEAAKQELLDIARAAAKDNAPRVPSALACRYCPAYATDACPESAGILERLPAVSSATDKLKAMASAKIGELLDVAKVAEKMITMLEEEAKARLIAGESIPGYKLRAGATRLVISDARRALETLRDAGISKDKLWSAVSVSAKALIDVIAETEHETEKAATARLKEMLGDNIAEKKAEPSLARSK